MAARSTRSPRSGRGWLVAGALSALAVSLAAPPSPAASAAEALHPPQYLTAVSGAGGTITGTVVGPPGAAVTVQLATGPCSFETSGPGVRTLAPIPVVLDGDGVAHFTAPTDDLLAGDALWGTSSSGGTTTESSACAPVWAGKPTGFRVTGAAAGSATLTWTPTPGASTQRVTVRRRDGSTLKTVAVGGASTVTITGLGTSYLASFFLRSSDPADPADGYAATGPAVPPFRDIAGLTDQQYRDFAGRPAQTLEGLSWARDLADGVPTVRAKIVQLASQPAWAGARDPITRLYLAAFGRLPDRRGLDFWSARRRAGEPIRTVAATFAASSEFRAKYGSLSNAGFVGRVYRNVLHRTPDSGGLAYWTKRLDARQVSRADLLAQFSESSEHQRATAATVSTVDLVGGMLRRMPTASELAAWAPASGPAPDPAALVLEILGSSAYGDRLA